MMGNPDIVFQSYGRSCNNPAFFEDFYTIFMGKSADIRAMFANTNMSAQRALLSHSLGQQMKSLIPSVILLLPHNRKTKESGFVAS